MMNMTIREGMITMTVPGTTVNENDQVVNVDSEVEEHKK